MPLNMTCFFPKAWLSHNLFCNRLYSYSQYWTGTSLHWRLMRGNVLKIVCICKPFCWSSTQIAWHCLIIVQASLFPNLSVYFGRPNQHSLGLVSCTMIPTDSLEKKPTHSAWFKALEIFKCWGRLLEVWLTIGLEVSKPIGFHGS